MLMKLSVKHFSSTEVSRDLWKQASRSWVGGQWQAVRHRWTKEAVENDAEDLRSLVPTNTIHENDENNIQVYEGI